MSKLKKANQIIEQIASKNKNITPLTQKDFPLFQKFFNRERHSYGNSWTYITQGMYGIGKNNLGYKYYDGENLSAVCVYPKIEQPDVNVFYWIRPMGKTILEKIVDLSQNLLKNQGLPTYVKKIFKVQFDYLQKKGFKDVSLFPWHSTCPSEDDTYPEAILDIAKTLTLAETAKKNKRIYRSFQYYRHFLREAKIKLQTLWDNPQIAKRILHDFFEFIKKRDEKNVSKETDFYNLFVHHPKPTNTLANIVYIDGVPLGFYFLEKQNQQTASLYATITLRHQIHHLSEFIFFHLLYTLKNDGFLFLNLGGSETQSLDYFKSKFQPTKKNKMYWAVFL
jgi:hypothetical protein